MSAVHWAHCILHFHPGGKGRKLYGHIKHACEYIGKLIRKLVAKDAKHTKYTKHASHKGKLREHTAGIEEQCFFLRVALREA